MLAPMGFSLAASTPALSEVLSSSLGPRCACLYKAGNIGARTRMGVRFALVGSACLLVTLNETLNKRSIEIYADLASD